MITFCHYHVNLLIPFVVLNLLLSSYSYYLIYKDKLYYWTLVLYFIIIEIMLAGTICLGFEYGFSLYSISMITVAFYIYYIGYKLNKSTKQYKYIVFNPVTISLLSLLGYFACYLFIIKRGPLYSINSIIKHIFFVYNSTVVFTIMISYMFMYLSTIIHSENKLEEMALKDKLTGLYNRHYLLAHLDQLGKENLNNYWIAIADIDNFKKVNDIYGHNCGDYVLRTVADTAVNTCGKCTVCRWGGEEFIILASSEKESYDILEKFRHDVSEKQLSFEDRELSVTLTIGTEKYASSYSVDEWISEADKKLYDGKRSGKNRVVY